MDELLRSMSGAHTSAEVFNMARRKAAEMDARAAEIADELALIDETRNEAIQKLTSLRSELRAYRRELLALGDRELRPQRALMEFIDNDAPDLRAPLDELRERYERLQKLEFERKFSSLEHCVLETIPNPAKHRDALAAFQELLALTDSSDEFSETARRLDASHQQRIARTSQAVHQHVERRSDELWTAMRAPFFEPQDLRGFDREVAELRTLVHLDELATTTTTTDGGESSLFDRFLQRFRQRFKIHFDGTLQTNDPARPELYFAQTTFWLTSNEELVGAVFCTQKISEHRALQKFAATLLTMVCNKTSDLLNDPQVRDNPRLFAHMIDAALAFSTELEGFPYANGSEEGGQESPDLDRPPDVLALFERREVLEVWLRLEQECVSRALDELLLDDEMWRDHCDSRELGNDIDAYCAPECVVRFVVLADGLRSRFSRLRDPTARAHFVALQRTLVDEFRTRLTQLAAQRVEIPTAKRFLQLMNAAWYLADVLAEWSNGFASSSSLADEAELLRNAWRGWAGAVADAVAAHATDFVDARAMSSTTTAQGQQSAVVAGQKELSDAICPLLFGIRTTLGKVMGECAPVARADLFRRTTQVLARVLLDEMVTRHSYSAASAAQLLHDLRSGLVPMLAAIAHAAEQRPQSGRDGGDDEPNDDEGDRLCGGAFVEPMPTVAKLPLFVELVSRLTLLSLPQADLRNLRRRLSPSIQNDEAGALAALAAAKIHGLKREEALEAMRQRVDMRAELEAREEENGKKPEEEQQQLSLNTSRSLVNFSLGEAAGTATALPAAVIGRLLGRR